MLRYLAPAAAIALFAACLGRSPTRSDDPRAKTPFDTSVAGLPEAETTQVLHVRNGDTVRLKVEFVAKWVPGGKLRMLAYNRSIPGPTIRAPQGSQITLLLTNATGLPTTLHSHGVRLDFTEDGVDQLPIDSGETHAYRIRFPDPGIYWYHPHLREDYQQDLGLSGNYLVDPADTAYWPPVNREVILMLDDVLMDNGRMRPYYRGTVDHTMMGRFGNVFLINGDTAFVLRVKRKETIRFYVTNASSARVFNLQFSRDTDLNIIGADNGRYLFPTARESDILPPSERLIFQVHFQDGLDDYDTLELWNKTPQKTHVIGRVIYEDDTAAVDYSSSLTFIESPQVAASIEPFRPYFDKEPDEEITLSGYMDMSKTLARQAQDVQHDPASTDQLGIEWSDSLHVINGQVFNMASMNKASNLDNMHWSIKDIKTGKVNHDIHWKFKRDGKILIRVCNEAANTDPNAKIMVHAMPHPIHFHGQRFLVVKENGKLPGGGMVWKDSFLIGTGFTVDLLLDAGNPGDWMFHCHISEHLQNGMMGHFSVGP